jgi:hypothetical protein
MITVEAKVQEDYNTLFVKVRGEGGFVGKY